MKVVLTILYLLIGFLIGNIDYKAAVMYFTVLPIQFWLLYYHFKKKHFVLICLFSIFLLAFGINPIFFFLNQDDAVQWGYMAIGNYDFSLSGYFRAYSKALVFMLVIHFVFINTIRPRVNIISFINTSILSLTRLTTGFKYTLYTIFFSILFCAVSIWMFNNSIGLIGTKPKQLPYHLAGILFYLRNYVFVLIIIYLYIKSSNKNIAFVFVLLFAIIGGVTASSKGLSIMVLVPMIYESFLTKHRTRAVIGVVFAVYLYSFVALSRDLVHMFDQVEYDISTVMLYSFDASTVFDSSLFTRLLESLTSRFYGSHTIVLADQYQLTSFLDIIKYFGGARIEDIIPDYVPTVFGLDLPEDMNFGVAIGCIGTVILLASGSYFLIIVQALLFGVILRFVEKRLRIAIENKGMMIGLLAVLLSAICVIKIIQATGMMTVYGILFILYIVSKYDLIPLHNPLHKILSNEEKFCDIN